MEAHELLCNTCKFARMSHAKAIGCRSIGDPLLAYRYGKCRRYQTKNGSVAKTPRNNAEPTLFDEL